jgi:hypothetical protein
MVELREPPLTRNVLTQGKDDNKNEKPADLLTRQFVN